LLASAASIESAYLRKKCRFWPSSPGMGTFLERMVIKKRAVSIKVSVEIGLEEKYFEC
jgi:hypothetical protein